MPATAGTRGRCSLSRQRPAGAFVCAVERVDVLPGAINVNASRGERRGHRPCPGGHAPRRRQRRPRRNVARGRSGGGRGRRGRAAGAGHGEYGKSSRPFRPCAPSPYAPCTCPATQDECNAVVEAALEASEEAEEDTTTETPWTPQTGTRYGLTTCRLYGKFEHSPVPARGRTSKNPLPASTDALLEAILVRTLAHIDKCYPLMVAALFGDPDDSGAGGSEVGSSPTSLAELYTRDELVFAQAEPAINVYGKVSRIPHRSICCDASR